MSLLMFWGLEDDFIGVWVIILAVFLIYIVRLSLVVKNVMLIGFDLQLLVARVPRYLFTCSSASTLTRILKCCDCITHFKIIF